MSFSSSDAAIPANALTRRLGAAYARTPHLSAAFAVSAVLHAVIAAGLGPLFGQPGGGARHAPSATLRVTMRNQEDTLPAQSAAAAAVPPVSPGAAADTAPSPVLPGPRYYRTRELDVRPGIMMRVEPEYPEAAARRMLSGKVRIRLLIGESGEVERIEILEADPPGYFESSVQRAFGAARFSPGMIGGRAVRVQLLLEVAFDGPPPPTEATR